MWRVILWLNPLEFLFIRLVHPDPSAICQLQFRFPYPGIWFPLVSARVSCDSLHSPACLCSLGGEPLYRWPSFTERSEKNCCYFSLFSLLLINKMEWCLPNFLHAGWETFPKSFGFFFSTWMDVGFYWMLFSASVEKIMSFLTFIH